MLFTSRFNAAGFVVKKLNAHAGITTKDSLRSHPTVHILALESVQAGSSRRAKKYVFFGQERAFVWPTGESNIYRVRAIFL